LHGIPSLPGAFHERPIARRGSALSKPKKADNTLASRCLLIGGI